MAARKRDGEATPTHAAQAAEQARAHDAGPVETLAAVRRAAAKCKDCPLWEIGTQTVFADGPANARLMLIGEAPGYSEDKEGRPFVGAAGRLFNEGLAQAGIDRAEVYVTNTVKHRPWVPDGTPGKEAGERPDPAKGKTVRRSRARSMPARSGWTMSWRSSIRRSWSAWGP